MIGDKHDKFKGKRIHPDKDYKDVGLGTETCMCTMCGEMFSTTRNFDKHRLSIEKAEKLHTSRCQNPTTVGLEFNKGVWKAPFNPNASFLSREAAAKGVPDVE